MTVRVTFPTCLSSSCDRPGRAACQVEWAEGLITVRSFGEVEHTGESACTDDCGAFVVDCESDPIPAGTYTLVHGSTSTTITLPTAPTQAIGGGPSFGDCS